MIHRRVGNTFHKFQDASGNDCSFCEVTRIVSSEDVQLYLYTTKKIDKVKERSVNLSAQRTHKDKNVEKANTTLDDSVLQFVQVNVYRKDQIQILLPNGNTDYYESIISLNISVTVARMKDFEDDLLLKVVLGKGAFGHVMEGIWKGKPVAVQLMKIQSCQKYIVREVKVSGETRHSNIMSLQAVFVNYQEVGLIMEPFDGPNLRVVLTDIHTKLKVNLDESKKVFICLQISRPVVLLHTTNIEHEYIKPENILVNSNGITKLCDIGFSRFEDLLPELLTTVGRNYKGTVGYMAPEIVLDNQPGKNLADIWAMACPFREIFTEDDTWELDPGIVDISDTYEAVLHAKTIPDLSEIPTRLRSTLGFLF